MVFVRAVDAPCWTCEALRACEIMNELGIPRNDAWPRWICKCKLLWDYDIVIVFYGLGCDLIQSDIVRLHLDQSSAYGVDRCLIDVTMAYCCPSFLALSIRWLDTPTEQAE